MRVITKKITLNTQGNTDIIDITQNISDKLQNNDISNGIITIFTPGATGSITTIEYEPGLLQDLPNFFEKIISEKKRYKHNDTWHDGNGHSHLRASLLGPSLTVPFTEKKLILGTWQQIIFIDFDNKPRNRNIILQILGD